MSSIPDTFKAFRIRDDEEGYRSGIEATALADLSEGDVTIRVGWSGINYKDALAATGKGKILRRYPLNGGIDVAGTVVESSSDNFRPGDRVLANGSGLSETRDGGFSEYLRLPENIVVPLPPGLSMREAMGIGTAVKDGLADKFKTNAQKAIDINSSHDEGGPLRALGRFHSQLPWPLQDLDTSRSLLEKANGVSRSAINLYFLADTERMDDNLDVARPLFEECAALDPAKSKDPPATRRNAKRCEDALKGL